MKKGFITFLIVSVSGLSGFGQNKNINALIWTISSPVFEQGKIGSFDEIAVKDPSIVHYENEWHLFYTARSRNEYTTAYTSAKTLDELNTAARYELKRIRGKTRYGCAPQVFYFEPHKKWYLIFQNRDSNYQPAYSTNIKISNPNSWSKHQNLIEKDTDAKWIDFWVIADNSRVYLFYTEAHKGVMLRSTDIEDFPNNWSAAKEVFNNIHEAVHIYKVVNKPEYHMIYELNRNGVRSFGLAMAKKLSGPWERTTDVYASGDRLQYATGEKIWTEMVSHGEVIRSGYNQYLDYDPENCRWLIQGLNKKQLNSNYPLLPWKLGIIEMAE